MKPVPHLFLYFLLFVTAAGEVGVTSLLSSEVGVELLPLKVGVTLLSLVVGAGLPPSLSLFKSLPREKGEGLIRRHPDYSPFEGASNYSDSIEKRY